MTETSKRATIAAAYFRDRRLAHAELFKHRHGAPTAPFHHRIIDRMHGPIKNYCCVGFRDSARTTLAEEAMCIKVAFKEFNTGVVIGASLPLAVKRLRVIRREFERNRRLLDLFGDIRGQPWTDEQLTFTNGITVLALGKGQAMRGIKEDTFRPDFVLGDDMEAVEDWRTAEGREKFQSWFFGEVLNAMDPDGRVVVLANIKHSECLGEQLKKRDSGFVVDVFPIEYLDENGQRKPTWPGRGIPGVDGIGMAAINAKRDSLYAVGRAQVWLEEYMCQAAEERAKPFRPEMRRVEPRARTWEAVYVMYDPARTTGEQSATTGKAVWSWLSPTRLHFWHLSAMKLLPDEIIADMLATQETYSPVKMGFEQDGLNEWAMQPIRAAMARKGIMMPLFPVKAPAGKIDFIRSLQVYFTPKEVTFQEDFDEAWRQFLSFSAGPIDAPNAAAYALHPSMKAGVPMYEDWNVVNVMPDLPVERGRAAWLAMNAEKGMVTAILCQQRGESLTVLADWVREGEALDVVRGILREASMEAGRHVKCVTGPQHDDRYTNVGLVQAIARSNAERQSGTVPDAGRDEISGLLRRVSRGLPGLLVSSAARWTLNGFAGGYCRAVLRGGELAAGAEEGVYKTVMEGLESFAGLMRLYEGDEGGRNYVTNDSGQRYISALPGRRR